jgi:hypothetical protein
LFFSYALKMVQDCDSIDGDVMDYPYFERTMKKLPEFIDNFCVTAIQVNDLVRRHSSHQLEQQTSKPTRTGCARCIPGCQKKGREAPAASNDGEEDEGTEVPSSSPRETSFDGAMDSLHQLSIKVWNEHIKRRQLTRLTHIDDGLNVDGSLSPGEAVQMLIQHVPTVDGTIRKELLPTHDQNGVSQSETPDPWQGSSRVSKDDWIEYIEQLVEQEGYPEELLVDNMDRMLTLHRIWPQWVETASLEERRKAPRWTAQSSYHQEPTLHFDVTKVIVEHMWMTEWRHKRAIHFSEFHARVIRRLLEEAGGIDGAADRASGSPRTTFGTEEQQLWIQSWAHQKFNDWDGPKCGGLSKAQLSAGLAEVLSTPGNPESAESISHEVDMLMHLAIDLDPHGPGYVHRTDFVNFVCLPSDEVSLALTSAALLDAFADATACRVTGASQGRSRHVSRPIRKQRAV